MILILLVFIYFIYICVRRTYMNALVVDDALVLIIGIAGFNRKQSSVKILPDLLHNIRCNLQKRTQGAQSLSEESTLDQFNVNKHRNHPSETPVCTAENEPGAPPFKVSIRYCDGNSFDKAYEGVNNKQVTAQHTYFMDSTCTEVTAIDTTCTVTQIVSHNSQDNNKQNTNDIVNASNKNYSSKSKSNATNSRHHRYNQQYVTDMFSGKHQDTKIFKVGVKFHYGKETKFADSSNGASDSKSTNDDVLIEKAKWKNLKEELTQNTIESLSVTQYDKEKKKARNHFNSDYRKQTYSDMLIDHILALMVYCNFDKLQFKFSKTYWDSEYINQHWQFYYLGLFIKEAVHEFGNVLQNDDKHQFYHGIRETLLLPTIINAQIYCPLSTSSSKDVAINFTDFNGIMIQFGAPNVGNAKEFSLSWLSDYSNEQEHLFIQNDWGLKINDIVDASTGCEYAQLINGLKDIHAVLKGLPSTGDSNCSLIKNIVEHQLSHTMDEFKPISTLNEYGNGLIDNFFKTTKILHVNYKHKIAHIFMHNAFMQPWIDVLFPNIELIRVENIALCQETIEDVYTYLLNIDQNNNLCSIVLKFSLSGYATSNIIDFIIQHNDKFESVGFTLRRGQHNNSRLYFEKTCINNTDLDSECSGTEEHAYSDYAETYLDSEFSGSEENTDRIEHLEDKYPNVTDWFLNSVCLSNNGYDTLGLIKSYITEDRLKQIGVVKQA
eukprot:79719_1